MMSRISRDLAAHHAYSKSPMRASSTQRVHNQEMPRVAVVGTGLSGLRCADVLLRNGTNVTLFEARNRIGGRVHQYVGEEHTYDMGPNWIHGTEGNPIMNLAEKTGTIVLEPEERQIIIDPVGSRISEERAFDLGAETWATIVDAFKYSNENHAEIDPQRSLTDFFRDELLKKYPNDKAQVQERINEARMWGPFVGDPIDRQSLRNFFLEECLEGENVVVASTYSKILAEVSKTARQHAEIRLGEEVVKIVYREPNDTQTKVVVTTARGEQLDFDEVVVTCPLGWLKHNKKRAFSPALPLRLSQAIDNISYGNLEKVYATFPSAWWMGDGHNELTNGKTNGHTDASPEIGSTPLFIHFHHPQYHPDPASKKNEFWNQSVVNLALFPKGTAQPTLLFYMYGPCSLHFTSLLRPHKPNSEEYNTTIWDFLEPFVSRLPFYSTADAACTPKSFVATQWSNDPFAGYGSYSNFQIGLMHGDEDIRCMRETGGLGEEGRGLWFAGEHTAPFVAIGTTTGAYWSGEAVARRVLNRYGVKDIDTGDAMLNGVEGEGPIKELDSQPQDGANLAGLAI